MQKAVWAVKRTAVLPLTREWIEMLFKKYVDLLDEGSPSHEGVD